MSPYIGRLAVLVIHGMAVVMKGIMVMNMAVAVRMAMATVRMRVERFLAPYPLHQHPQSYCEDHKASHQPQVSMQGFVGKGYFG